MGTEQGKVALITGGGSGIGAATARLLAKSGIHVLIASQLPMPQMQTVCDGIETEGGRANAEEVDVADDAAVQAMVERIAARHGRIDFLVNSAGIYDMTPLFGCEPGRIKRLFDVNVLGSIHVMNSVLPIMRAQRFGSIVNVASAAAVLGQGGTAAYSASKAAILSFTQTMVPELARSGIRANVVAPGAVRTDMTAVIHTPQSPEMAKALTRVTERSPSPFGTPFAEPEDVASVIVFLLSNTARAIHGACVVVDQGLTAAMATMTEPES